MHEHPVLRYLTALYEVKMIDAFKMKDLPPRTPRLIESENNNSLLLTLSRGSFTDLVMTFAIIDDTGSFNTDWPLKPSFPLFLRNVLYALGNISDGASEENELHRRPARGSSICALRESLRRHNGYSCDQ